MIPVVIVVASVLAVAVLVLADRWHRQRLLRTAYQQLEDWLAENERRLLSRRESKEKLRGIAETLKGRRNPKEWNRHSPDFVIKHNKATHATLVEDGIASFWCDMAEVRTSDGVTAWPDAAGMFRALDGHEVAALLDEDNLSDWRLPQSLRTDIYRLLLDERKAVAGRVSEEAVKAHAALFGRVEKHPLTADQRTAAVMNDNFNLVVAGAGSGKTSLIVARTLYLLKTGCRPDEMLLLAYNRDAADELRKRLKEKLGDGAPECRTFHSLGLRLAEKFSGGKLTVSPLAIDTAKMSDFVLVRIGRLPELERIILSPAAAWEIARNPDTGITGDKPAIRTMRGIFVRSKEEAAITNFLELLGYKYTYEKPYGRGTGDYRPDWFLGRHGGRDVYLEHFGIDRHGNTADEVDATDYNRQIDWKRSVHRAKGTVLLETYSYNFAEGDWHYHLLQQLVHWVGEPKLGGRRQDEFMARLYGNKLKSADEALADRIMLTISLAKETDTDLEAHAEKMAEEAAQIGLSQRDVDVLRQAALVSGDYEERLRQKGEIDFADMCRLASSGVKAVDWQSPWSHVLVDEFQDITETRVQLLSALLESRPGAKLFAAGDDWQAIYGFTGADVSLMLGFADRFTADCMAEYGGKPDDYTGIRALEQTFRYSQNLADISGEFIMANEAQIRKQVRGRSSTALEGIDVIFHDEAVWDENGYSNEGMNRALYDALLAIGDHIPDGETASLMLLARYNYVLDRLELEEALKEMPETALKISKPRLLTIHKSKGLEADYVILAGLSPGLRGFPRLSNNGMTLQDTFLGKSCDSVPYAEERRVFYVALTRARKRVIVLAEQHTKSGERSPFAIELDAMVQSREDLPTVSV